MNPSNRFGSVTPSVIREMVSKADALAAQGHAVARCEIGRPDFDSPQVAKDAVNRALDEGRVHYAPNAGIPQLRNAIAEDLNARLDLSLPAENVIVTNGAIEALFVSLMALIDPGDEVVIPEPCWPYYGQMLSLIGGVPRYVATSGSDGFRCTPESIEASISDRTRAIMINTPNNPTGSVATADDIQAIVDIATTHDLALLTDEVYERFVFDGAEHVSPARYDSARDRTFVIGSMSKTYSMTGWRIGFAIVPDAFIRPVTLGHTYTNASISTFNQFGATAAIEHAQHDVDHMLSAYARRREIARDAFADMPGFELVQTKGTFYVFSAITDPGYEDLDVARRLLDEAHIATVPGSSFGPSGAGYLRVSIACEDGQLARGLERMGEWGAKHLAG